MEQRMVWVTIFLAACGGDDGGAVDAAPGADAAIDAAVDAPGPSTYRAGAVLVVDDVAQTTLGASFQGTTGEISDTTEGACRTIALANVTATHRAAAGAITISGGALPATTMQPDGIGAYGAQLAAMHYQGNDVLTVAATGGEVPAFTGTVAVPVAQLALTSELPATLRRATGLAVTWTPAASGSVALTIAAGTMDQTLVFCAFPASAGTGTVPGARLAPFANGALVSVGAQMLNTTTVTAGPFEVSLNAVRGFAAASATVAD
jgi:hypothetical protein